MKKIFSESTVRVAAEMVRNGRGPSAPSWNVSDTLTREDIENAFRTASRNVAREYTRIQ